MRCPSVLFDRRGHPSGDVRSRRASPPRMPRSPVVEAFHRFSAKRRLPRESGRITSMASVGFSTASLVGVSETCRIG